MQKTKLIFICHPDEPESGFMVCDLTEGRKFIDPLNVLYLYYYDLHEINKEGFYAFGGEINTETLVDSYKWGIFPWFSYKESPEPYWFCPKERFVIFPDKIHVGHSLRNLMNKNKYTITINQAFKEVIHNCRHVDSRDKDSNAWLGEKIEKVFIELHYKGYAKSIEVWEDNELVGGFYGFFHKGVFQGESMFSFSPSASQIGLIELCRNPYIEGEKIKFIDTQFETPTFKRLGGEYISYKKYREIMDLSL